MPTVNEWWHELTVPFTPAQTHWRFGSMKRDKTAGMVLAYIDARHVMDRLDAVCGPAGWQCAYPHVGDKTICELEIWCPSGEPDCNIEDSDWRWIKKADGAGSTDIEGEKGAISDALKRAAVRFGIGRYLYSLDTPWVPAEHKWGKQIEASTKASELQISKDGHKQLDDILMKSIGHILEGTRGEKNMLRCLIGQIRRIPTPELVDQWAKDNGSYVKLFLKAYQEEIANACRVQRESTKEAV